jgi:hypothetical protein
MSEQLVTVTLDHARRAAVDLATRFGPNILAAARSAHAARGRVIGGAGLK